MQRRSFLKTTAYAGTAIALTGCIGTQPTEYPSEDIRFVVPFAAGGGFDEIARLAQPYWEEYLPEEATLVVENVEGGGSAVGTAEVYSADPDGYSLLFNDPFSSGARQIVTDPGYDIRDMTFIGHFSHEPHGIAAAESLNLQDWNDFVNRIDEFNFATQGTGSVAHITPLLLAEITGEFDIDDITFVHYTGTGEAMAGLERGETNIYMVGSASSALVARALDSVEHFMMFTTEEIGGEFFPNTRYFAGDLDIPNIDDYIELSSFQRFVAGPPEVPGDILEIQRSAMTEILDDDDFHSDALDANRFLLNFGTGEETREIAERKLDHLSQGNWPSLLDDMLN
jgi:tripartite-type tricarboxylate transporter receptor subunit TctC